jgi:MFS family permease
MASEMLYPVMPLYLKQVGYTALFIGILEGAAEAVAGLSKSYFGKLSDRSGKRLPFVQLGYALSAISKPMLALLIYPAWIFLSRGMDRLGKGIRTGARDALLSDESTPATKASVFGFHRSLDTMGAVLGPGLALLYLYYFPAAYQDLFLVALLPGLFAVGLSLVLKEKQKVARQVPAVNTPVRFFSFFSYWKKSSGSYRNLSGGLLVFALINSSDVFLLLKMSERGVSDTTIIAAYIFYNLIYALAAWPAGILADKIGKRKLMVAGLALFALVYAGFSVANHTWSFALLLVLYGLYAAATEGIAKAWISNITPRRETATAIGTFTGLQSLAALFASSLSGLLWFYAGSGIVFVTAAVVALCVCCYLLFSKIPEAHSTDAEG